MPAAADAFFLCCVTPLFAFSFLLADYFSRHRFRRHAFDARTYSVQRVRSAVRFATLRLIFSDLFLRLLSSPFIYFALRFIDGTPFILVAFSPCHAMFRYAMSFLSLIISLFAFCFFHAALPRCHCFICRYAT